jgi:hypothetical protein
VGKGTVATRYAAIARLFADLGELAASDAAIKAADGHIGGKSRCVSNAALTLSETVPRFDI